jgi:murein L,D-transpeptidase YcbB/YkuD
MNSLMIPLLLKIIQLAFPQIAAAITAGIPIAKALTDAKASPDLIALLEQIGKAVFPGLPGATAQGAAGGIIFHTELTRVMQANLNKLGATPPLAADGVYGPATKQAVANFQTDHGLDVDGWAGPVTTAAIATAIKALK